MPLPLSPQAERDLQALSLAILQFPGFDWLSILPPPPLPSVAQYQNLLALLDRVAAFARGALATAQTGDTQASTHDQALLRNPELVGAEMRRRIAIQVARREAAACAAVTPEARQSRRRRRP